MHTGKIEMLFSLFYLVFDLHSLNRAQYTRRKFRTMYAQTRRLNNTHRNSASFTRYYGNNLTLGVLADSEHFEEESLFEYPFNELLVRNLLFTCYLL